ncbi:MAG: M20/M25/M40 family metallo-hydrolase [Oscillospiraceae bacterium]|nr:M20/M25/M40 family metallo-hydrolase [Oscillospiraceae bacterium]
MKLTQEILDYIEAHRQEAYDLLLELARIPAPSNHERKRAEFVKAWLDAQGAEGVYIDEALNVIYPVGCTDSNDLMVFAAHSDVVFPDTDMLPLRVENGRIYCPGVGDDTACVAALLTAAKYIARNRLSPKGCGVLLVVNSGEEGLGNLKGSRKLMEDFGSRIREFITFDGRNGYGVHKAVGSRRYRVEIDTEGGHSYSAFGNRNAIAYLASMIDTLYSMKVPEKGKTTYNVGTISGGTSVNTIAQHAEMLYEFRSDERESLDIMERHFRAAVEFYRAKGIAVTVTQVGDRPCSGDVDEEKLRALMARASDASVRHYGREIAFGPGSTDCNIPLSMGIPAICVGCYDGGGAHTREEYVEIEGLLPGLKAAFGLILYHF